MKKMPILLMKSQMRVLKITRAASHAITTPARSLKRILCFKGLKPQSINSDKALTFFSSNSWRAPSRPKPTKSHKSLRELEDQITPRVSGVSRIIHLCPTEEEPLILSTISNKNLRYKLKEWSGDTLKNNKV
jgi:hypothetical protein